MPTPESTSADWQKHANGLVVLPIGALEQHSRHLPIDTDSRLAWHFARLVAAQLEAALLPVLPFGTSLEHSGFRGTVTLRPHTLMQIVHDIAVDLEEQHFRVLIILNGHGGNYALGPVVREWNRADRPLKILLFNYWESCDAGLFEGATPDVHAGEFETSLLLHVAPGLVHDSELVEPADPFAGQGGIPLRQGDLNTFGFGCFSTTGALGNPQLATRAKGEAFETSTLANLLPLLRDRLARLEAQPRYAGAAPQYPRVGES